MLWFTYYKGTFSTFVFASQNRAFMLRSVLRTLRPYIHLTQKLTARGLKLTCFSMRELPGGPRSGGEAMSEAKPGRERPRRGHAQIIEKQLFTKKIKPYRLNVNKFLMLV
jgi:hypothetical protein